MQSDRVQVIDKKTIGKGKVWGSRREKSEKGGKDKEGGLERERERERRGRRVV
jgi:hypothetical protein